MIDLSKVVMVTRIINPILDKEDLIKEEYMLDVYAKSKGDVESE
jgi:ribosome maturation factor RimP